MKIIFQYCNNKKTCIIRIVYIFKIISVLHVLWELLVYYGSHYHELMVETTIYHRTEADSVEVVEPA